MGACFIGSARDLPRRFETQSGPVGFGLFCEMGLSPAPTRSTARAVPAGKKFGRPIHQPAFLIRTRRPLEALIESVFEGSQADPFAPSVEPRLSRLSVRSCNATRLNQEEGKKREPRTIEKRLDHSRVEPTPFFARALGRNLHRQMVSRPGLEPGALALKGRCSTD